MYDRHNIMTGNRCRAIVKGMPVNDGDGMGMKVPCEFVFHG